MMCEWAISWDQRRRLGGFSVVLVALAMLALSRNVTTADAPLSIKTGAALRQELRKAINVYRQRVRVRDVVAQLADMHGIAILLDRRVDPDRIIDVQLAQMTLQQGLKQLAVQLDADAAVVGGTVVIGPQESLDRMRTDIALQQQAMLAHDSERARQRSVPLLLGKSFRWDDLKAPTDLLREVAAAFDLVVADIDLVPHDLWAEGVMADVSAVEAVALVAGQFDVTFDWNEDLTAIRLAPSAPRLTIEQSHSVTKVSVEDALEAARLECPLATIEPDGRRLHIVGTVGEHELIAAICANKRGTTRVPTQGPLRNRTFTLNQKRYSVSAVLRTLETLDVIVEYDPEALTRAGVDLSQKVTLSLSEASADEFFQALCEPLGLAYEIDGKTVRLMPAADVRSSTSGARQQ